MQPGYGYGYGYAPMPPQRSTTPRTLGTLSMVFGGLVVATSLFGLLTSGRVGSFMHVDASQQPAFDRYVDEIHTPSMIVSATMLVMSIWLFVIGTGQRAYKRWAVKQSLAWGAVAILVVIGNFIVQLTVIMPALDRFIDAISHGASVPASGAMKFGIVLGVGFYVPYPIVMLTSFRKPHIVEAMDQPPQAGGAADVF